MNGTMINSYSGIKTHQFGLDSVANNIANVNTLGYRENQPRFESMFAQNMDSLNANSAINNDYNYGVTKSSNDISTRSGSYKKSDGELEVAYEGKGWFVVGENKNGSFTINDDGYESKQKTYFTRDGSFARDGDGYVVNSRGFYMYGVDLGKIDGNTFNTSKSATADIENLSSGEMKPLQIPQDLYFKPVLTTKVDLSVNLNKTQNSAQASEFYSQNGKFDEARFWGADINGFSVDSQPLDSTTYDKIKIALNNKGRLHEVELNYGKDFRTFADLKNALLEKVGLDLDLARLPDGSVSKAGLKITNAGFAKIDVSISGNLADKLGISGRNDHFKSGVDSDWRASKGYKNGDVVNFEGIAFRYLGENGNSEPLQNQEDWEILDTSSLGFWKQNATYELGEMINFEGFVYRKIGRAGNSEPLDSENWEQISESKNGVIAQFEEGVNYAPKSLVRYQGKIYERTIEGASTPQSDKVGWKVLNADSFESKYLEVPKYQSNVEIYNEAGEKFLIQTHYYLVNSADATSNPHINEKWEARTQLFDKDGLIPIGNLITSNIEFDEQGNAISPTLTLPFGESSIEYSFAGSENKKSSNHLYQDSQILQTTQDGKSEGHLQDMRVDKDGIIFLYFTNGAMEAMGRVGISAFVNDQGLKKVGGNMFEMNEIINNGESHISSGRPLLGWSGQHLRFGSILYKHLETSNVDVGNALTDLIMMQRGYSMNAKAFTTGDDLVKEALNLKR